MEKRCKTAEREPDAQPAGLQEQSLPKPIGQNSFAEVLCGPDQ